MKLHVGQSVHGTNGEFGAVADVVVDNAKPSVTHVVVEVSGRLSQARLLPVAGCTAEGGVLRANLTVEQMRGLQRVAFAEFVEVAGSKSLSAEWDVTAPRFLASALHESPAILRELDASGEFVYGRAPIDTCEIRRNSSIISSDDQLVGHVAGFLMEEENIAGVIAEVHLHGVHHSVVLPVQHVDRVRNDTIEISMTRGRFRMLPHLDELNKLWNEASRRAEIKDRLRQIPGNVRARKSAAVSRANSLVSSRSK